MESNPGTWGSGPAIRSAKKRAAKKRRQERERNGQSQPNPQAVPGQTLESSSNTTRVLDQAAGADAEDEEDIWQQALRGAPWERYRTQALEEIPSTEQSTHTSNTHQGFYPSYGRGGSSSGSGNGGPYLLSYDAADSNQNPYNSFSHINSNSGSRGRGGYRGRGDYRGRGEY